MINAMTLILILLIFDIPFLDGDVPRRVLMVNIFRNLLGFIEFAIMLRASTREIND